MSLHENFGQPLLTFPDAEKSPLSIRAKRCHRSGTGG